MACLNEFIARKANIEDDCTGRFWEGRFKSKALVDITALLSCMAYVDLNPVRAGIASNLQNSDFTSIQDRVRQVSKQSIKRKPQLMAFSESKNLNREIPTIPFHLKEYIELVDWTGRIIREKRRGSISAQEPKILTQLNISATQWVYLALEIQKRSINTIHGLERLKNLENQQANLKAA